MGQIIPLQKVLTTITERNIVGVMNKPSNASIASAFWDLFRQAGVARDAVATGVLSVVVGMASAIDAQSKTCSRCLEDKSPTAFGKDAQKNDGLSSYCKPCRRAIDLFRRSCSPGPIKLAAKKHYKKNKKNVNRSNAEQFQRRKQNLTDTYIVSNVLRGNAGDFPKELIEAKRVHLQIKRHLKNGN